MLLDKDKFAAFFTLHVGPEPTRITVVLHRYGHPIEVGAVGAGCQKPDCLLAYTSVDRKGLMDLLQSSAPVEVPPAVKEDGTPQSIWERRMIIDKARRTAHEERIRGLDAVYRDAIEALQAECAASEKGHEWHFNHWNVGHAEVYYCNFCQARKIVEEGEP